MVSTRKSAASQANAASFAARSSATTTPNQSSTIRHRSPKPSPSVTDSPDYKPEKGLKGMFGFVKTPSPRQHQRAEAFFGISSPGGSSVAPSSSGSRPRLTHAAKLALEETQAEMERRKREREEEEQARLRNTATLRKEAELARKVAQMEAELRNRNPERLAEIQKERERRRISQRAEAANARVWQDLQRVSADLKDINAEHVQKLLERKAAEAETQAALQHHAAKAAPAATPAEAFAHPPPQETNLTRTSSPRKRRHAEVEEENDHYDKHAAPNAQPSSSSKRTRIDPAGDHDFEVLYIPSGQEQPPPAATPRSSIVSPIQNENHDPHTGAVSPPHTRHPAPHQATASSSAPQRSQAQLHPPHSPAHPLHAMNPIAEASTRLFSHAARSWINIRQISSVASRYAAKALDAAHVYDEYKRLSDAMKAIQGEASYAAVCKWREYEEFKAKNEALQELLVMQQEWWDEQVEGARALGGEVVVGGTVVEGAVERRDALAGLEERSRGEILRDMAIADEENDEWVVC